MDVLYLLGREAALGLVAEAAAALAPGGALVVKEIDVRPRWKYELARAQELVSTRITRITEGTGVAFVPPDDLVAAIQSAARHASRFVQVLEQGGQSPDHPVHPAIPETRYLKSFFCRVTRE